MSTSDVAVRGRMAKRTALITGATGGIGLELARLLAADGNDLILVGRDRARLERAREDLQARHPISVQCQACDLSETGAALGLWKVLEAAGTVVDVLVNNAGVGLYGLVDEQDRGDLERMVQLNVATLTTLTRLALPGM